MRPLRLLTALPIFNEQDHLNPVLDEVVQYADDVLVVDDGSTDDTPKLLAARKDIQVVTHNPNRGYGAGMRTAFCYAKKHGYDVLVTIDCDGQHEPQLIQSLVEACGDADMVSGSRYLAASDAKSQAPAERRQINQMITREINERLGLSITDAFCGFKAYRVCALSKLAITDPGYAMPLELWVQAAYLGLKIVEFPVPLVYLDEKRSFGGSLDDGGKRMEYYHQVLDRAIAATQRDRRLQEARKSLRRDCISLESRPAVVEDCCPFFPC